VRRLPESRDRTLRNESLPRLTVGALWSIHVSETARVVIVEPHVIVQV
jgi:hypothetical protein